ncbi:hypothetical protein C8F01DRAFT_1228935 [Mycena amicta]|nr:hypothetical protein C8F01DRAFT_1228935 [Mycena amicta]
MLMLFSHLFLDNTYPCPPSSVDPPARPGSPRPKPLLEIEPAPDEGMMRALAAAFASPAGKIQGWVLDTQSRSPTIELLVGKVDGSPSPSLLVPLPVLHRLPHLLHLLCDRQPRPSTTSSLPESPLGPQGPPSTATATSRARPLASGSADVSAQAITNEYGGPPGRRVAAKDLRIGQRATPGKYVEGIRDRFAPAVKNGEGQEGSDGTVQSREGSSSASVGRRCGGRGRGWCRIHASNVRESSLGWDRRVLVRVPLTKRFEGPVASDEPMRVDGRVAGSSRGVIVCLGKRRDTAGREGLTELELALEGTLNVVVVSTEDGCSCGGTHSGYKGGLTYSVRDGSGSCDLERSAVRIVMKLSRAGAVSWLVMDGHCKQWTSGLLYDWQKRRRRSGLDVYDFDERERLVKELSGRTRKLARGAGFSGWTKAIRRMTKPFMGTYQAFWNF